MKYNGLIDNFYTKRDCYLQVHDILKRERREIESQILAEIDTTEVVFLEQALEMLKTKEDNINMQYDKPNIIEDIKEVTPIVYEKQEINDNKFDWFNVTEEGAACIEVIQEKIGEMNVSDSNLNPEAAAFSLSGVDGQLDEVIAPEQLSTESHQIVGSLHLTEIDKQNQAKYFYFYQG